MNSNLNASPQLLILPLPCAPLSPDPSPLPDSSLSWRSPASCAGNETVLHWSRYRPGAINLRSSAFICGSFFAEAPDSKDADRMNRMDRINLSTNPVNPVHPVRSSFSAAPDINCSTFIKVWISQNPSPRYDRCAYLLHMRLPKFDVFATFAFSAVSRLAPQRTPKERKVFTN